MSNTEQEGTNAARVRPALETETSPFRLRPERPREKRVAHAAQQAGTIGIVAYATPPQRLDQQNLQEPLQQHFLAGLVIAAFVRDEFNHAMKPACATFRDRDVNDRRKQGQEQRSVHLFDAKCSAQGEEVRFACLLPVADRHVERIPWLAFDSGMAAQRKRRCGR